MPDQQRPQPTPVSSDPVGSLVGEFMQEKKKEIQDEKSRQVARKRSPFLVPLLLVLCAAIWISPSLMPPREEPVSQESLEQSARLTLYLASLRVRAYQDAHARLPLNLQEAGVDTAGIAYQRTSNSVFELSTQVQGARVVYRSAVPDSVFLGPGLRLRGIG
jgi:hypothetical protein